MSSGNTIAVIGDIHGCYNTLTEIYDHIKDIKEIYSVGDLIDRGKYSREVVEFCREKMIKPVKGNHEDMMIRAVDKSDKLLGFMSKEARHYFSNGGKVTQCSYIDSSAFSDFKKFKHQLKSLGHFEYLKNLPLKYEINKVVISHAGIIDGGNDISILWNRQQPAFLDQLQIFGHTPLKEMFYVKNYYSNIDTGCVYKNKLTSVIVDSIAGKIIDKIQINCNEIDVD